MFSVSEIMTSPPYSVVESALLGDVVTLMTDKHIRHVPVVDSNNQLVGLVTHRDVLAVTGKRLREQSTAEETNLIPVSEFLNRSIQTIPESIDLISAAKFMEKHKFGCLPVVKEKELTGIITETDFVAIAINLMEQLEASEISELS